MKPFMGNVERREETAGKRRGKVGKLKTDEEDKKEGKLPRWPAP